MLTIDHLTHVYDTEPVVRDLSFEVDTGELVCLLGPSGCGKTTVIQAIAGHLKPTSGSIQIQGTDVTSTPPETRDIGLMFQASTLFPHLTVGDNVEYGLKARGIEPNERKTLRQQYLDLVDLREYSDAYPEMLSGGQQRRVELARALAPEPDILLLDEPLSSLDRALREQLQDDIRRIQQDTGVTTVFVTHDQEEAMEIADRLVVMNEGGIAATGTPRSLYATPPNRFIASFLGPGSVIDAPVLATNPLEINIGGTAISIEENPYSSVPEDAVSCVIRPNRLTVESFENRGELTVPGEVLDVRDMGTHYILEVLLASGEQVQAHVQSPPPDSGTRVGLGGIEEALTLIPQDGK